MSEETALVKQVCVDNFFSLHNVKLSLKPLTVLVGPNASGKSNVLEVLHLLNWSMVYGQLPDILVLPEPSENHPIRITFQFAFKVKQTPAVYDLALESVENDASVDEESSISGRDNLPTRIVEETLLVDGVTVISTRDGQLMLRDENGENETSYKPNTLALTAAGNYGIKPITCALGEFIKGWEFHDFDPKMARTQFPRPPAATARKYTIDGFPSQRDVDFRDYNRFSPLSSLLLNWHDNDSVRFDKVNQSLEAAMDFKIMTRQIRGGRELCLSEGPGKLRTFATASDGTLRLITYFMMLNDPNLPPLIAIEEPERNLHPGALNAIADFLEQLAERTQVVVTTHSSQLLDAFEPESLSDKLGILLLRNPQGRGTEVTNLEDIRGNRPALDGWITDFGIGSAIFDSELLSEPMKESE